MSDDSTQYLCHDTISLVVYYLLDGYFNVAGNASRHRPCLMVDANDRHYDYRALFAREPMAPLPGHAHTNMLQALVAHQRRGMVELVQFAATSKRIRELLAPLWSSIHYQVALIARCARIGRIPSLPKFSFLHPVPDMALSEWYRLALNAYYLDARHRADALIPVRKIRSNDRVHYTPRFFYLARNGTSRSLRCVGGDQLTHFQRPVYRLYTKRPREWPSQRVTCALAKRQRVLGIHRELQRDMRASSTHSITGT